MDYNNPLQHNDNGFIDNRFNSDFGNLQTPTNAIQVESNTLYNNANTSRCDTDYSSATGDNIVNNAMDYNNPLRNNDRNIHNDNGFIGNRFNSYSGNLQTPTNVIQMEQPLSNTLYNNANTSRRDTDYFSATGNNIINNEQQVMFPFMNNEHVNSSAQSLPSAPQHTGHNTNVQPIQNVSTLDSSQTNLFRFEIPGFEIIIIPTTSSFANLTNLDMQQLQQNQNHLSSNTVTDNFQQQNSYDSFDFNNFRP